MRGVPTGDHLRDLPGRLTTSEVCALGRYTVRTFQRRRRDGKFLVEPIDRGEGGELIFPRDPVLRALKLIPDHAPAPQATPEKPRVSVDALRARRDAAVCRRASKNGRDVAGAVRGAGAAPALRLVVDTPASD